MRAIGGLTLLGLAAFQAGCMHEAGPNPNPDPGKDSTYSESPVDAEPLAATVDFQNPRPRVNHLSDIDFPTARVGYLVGQSGLILKTRDAGATFADTVLGREDLNAVAFFDTARGVAAGNRGTLLTTADGGATWKHQFVGGDRLEGLCAHPSGKAVAVGGTGTLLVSSDAGLSWSLADGGTRIGLNTCAFLNADSVYASGGEYLLLSGNGGKTWTKSVLRDSRDSTAYFHLDRLLVADARTGYGLMDGFPVRTGGRISTWRAWPGGDPSTAPDYILDLAVTSEGRVHVVGQAGRICTGEVEDGIPWVWHEAITDHNLNAVAFPSEDTGYAAGEFGEILRTVDGGTTWKSLSRAVTREDLRGVHFVDGKLGFAVGSAGTLLKTSDGGADWTRLEGAASRNLFAVHFLDAEVGCVVGESGTALWTRDGGKTWHLGGTGTTGNLVSIRVVGASTAYATGDGGMIKTIDGGLTWTDQQVHLLPDYGPDGFDVGDGLYFDASRLIPAAWNLAFYHHSLHYRYRTKVGGSDWRQHRFLGREESLAEYTRAKDSLFYGVGGSSVYRLDAKSRRLRSLNTLVTQGLFGIHCPEASTCFAVGGQGLILRFSFP